MGNHYSLRLNAATIATVLVMAAPWLSASSPVPPKIIHPTVYESPDTKYSLTVNPSDRLGYGPAGCKFIATESGEVMWEKSLPYTFRD